ncbi:50S ribosomal protein L33 [Streptococcus pneumoniae SP9-BS68]|nr:50S ribosomal protein L33 [Streptococcus pneumoniae SP19-BS75]EDK74220.1 hypothetical protein CGSSp3BS71_01682 [Streptococcus pneumoniae SP3-BS71]EDK79361.1 50S ribosomal protein L33 [Streptococcus pneumoniae SP9-BS68]EFL67112.1 hypothetical protein CGSSp14BS292_01363 [Streptococcus pneumoniae SP14-BS292]EFL69549.1 hypothetical protein CGSSpBS293_10033 [Streptococcus pneumoniae SP-BS293]EFL71687.1 hypothetical protein CGSSpBS458_03209 [Streptococcus pneumoniae BS458]EFL73424.1 hypothetical
MGIKGTTKEILAPVRKLPNQAMRRLSFQLISVILPTSLKKDMHLIKKLVLIAIIIKNLAGQIFLFF